jgi:hypothetical protein
VTRPSRGSLPVRSVVARGRIGGESDTGFPVG